MSCDATNRPARAPNKWVQDMLKRKLVMMAAGAAAVAGLGGWALLRDAGRQEYRTARVERGEIDATISATGTSNAVVTVQVGSQVSGNIKALYADKRLHSVKGGKSPLGAFVVGFAFAFAQGLFFPG